MADGIQQAGNAIAEAITQVVAQSRKERANKALLKAITENPALAQNDVVQRQLLEAAMSSQNPAEAMKSLEALIPRPEAALESQAQTLLPTLGVQPEDLQSQVVSQTFGAPPAGTPAGTQVQLAPTAPPTQATVQAPALPVLQQLAPERGFGVSIRGGARPEITLRSAAPSKRDADEASVMEVFSGIQEAGLDDVTAAQVTVRHAAKNRLIVPDAIRKLAFAQTENELAAARTRLEETARQQTQVKFARERAAEAATGRVLGTSAGQVDLLKNTATINFPGIGGEEPQTVEIPLSQLPQMTKPITDSTKLRGFLLPDGTLPPPGVSPAQLMAAGAVPVDTQSEQIARRIGGVGDIVGDMQVVADKLFPTDDNTTRAQNAARYYWDAMVGKKIPEVQKIATLNARIGQLVAALGGETASRLSDQDVVRMARGFGFGLFESKTSARVKIETIQRGITKLREGLLTGRLVPEITQLGGNPDEAARLLGIEREFATTEKRRQKAPAPGQGAGTPGAPAAGEPGAKAPQATGAQTASERVGGTLANLQASLEAEIAAGRMTEAEAIRRLNAAAQAGLPEGAPVIAGAQAPAQAPRKVTVNVGGKPVEVEVLP